MIHNLNNSERYLHFSNPLLIKKDLSHLIGILNGIKSDLEIHPDEQSALYDWIHSNKLYELKHPYSEVLRLLREAINDSLLTYDEVQDIIWFCKNYINENEYSLTIKNSLQELLGLITGISLDKKITIEELRYLDNWMNKNSFLKNNWPFDEVYSMLTRVLNDNALSIDEQNEFLLFCKALSVTETDNKNFTAFINEGFYQIDPEIIFDNKVFCFTGESSRYNRKDLLEIVTSKGGEFVNTITKRVDYLVVCDKKNSCWAFSCYGRKIEEVIKLRKNGHPVVIIHEFDFMDHI